jgi:hypothetical protein
MKHRTLMAAEAVLVVGLLRGLLESSLKAGHLPNYAKVLFLMAGTLGLFGGMYLLIESITSAGLKQTHTLLKRVSLPRIFVHAAVFAVLFVLYAKQQHLPLW